MKLGKDWILETTELIDQMYLDNELTPEEHSELDYILYEMDDNATDYTNYVTTYYDMVEESEKFWAQVGLLF